MFQIHIKQKRIHKLKKIDGFSKETIEIGVPVLTDEAQRVGLEKVGEVVLPSGEYGAQSKKNAYGFSYVDKTQAKEWRTVATIMMHPYGNENASEILVDIPRWCYPRVEVPPIGIELVLVKNDDGETFVAIDMNEDIRKNHLKEAINVMLEIYGECYIFDSSIKIKQSAKRTRRNWEILPKGDKPSVHLERQLRKNKETVNGFDVLRLQHIEGYDVNEIAEGLNGFMGYYAYVLDYCCVLESAIYGNATYIIPKDNWEELSQKTKKELIDEKQTLKKIIHNENWSQTIDNVLNNLKNLEL